MIREDVSAVHKYLECVASQRAADLQRQFPGASPKLLYHKAMAELRMPAELARVAS